MTSESEKLQSVLKTKNSVAISTYINALSDIQLLCEESSGLTKIIQDLKNDKEKIEIAEALIGKIEVAEKSQYIGIATPILLYAIEALRKDKFRDVELELLRSLSKNVAFVDESAKWITAEDGSENNITASLLLVLGCTGKTEFVNAIEIYTYDVTLWDMLVSAVFTPDRIVTVVQSVSEFPFLNDLVEISKGGDNAEEISRNLAENPSFKRSFAQFFASDSASKSFFKIIVDRKVIAAFKELFSDSDFLLRKAAYYSLSMIDDSNAIGILKQGIHDEKKNIRKMTKELLKTKIGQDAYDKFIEEEKQKNKDELNKLAELKGIVSNFTSSLTGGVADKLDSVFGSAKSVFKSPFKKQN